MLQKFKAFTFFALLLIVSGSRGQNPVIDSLKTFLLAAKEDTTKARTLVELSFRLRTSDPSEGINLAEKGIHLSDSLGWKSGMAKGYNSLGSNHKAKSEYPKALEAYQKALTLYEELDQPKDIATLLMNIGSVYRPLKQFDKALEYYRKALPIAEKIGAKKLNAQLLGNMGVVYFEQGNYDQQVTVSEQALKLFREVGDVDNESWILSNIGDAYAIKEDFKKAMEYQQMAIDIYDRIGNISYKSTSVENIGLYYYSMAVKEKDERLKKEYLRNSINYFNQAIDILKELNDIDYLKQQYLNMSNSQLLLGEYDSALSNYKTYTALKDSIFSLEAQESVTNLETKRELDLRDKEIVIQQLKKRTERIYMFAGVLFLLVIIGFIAVGYRRQKRSKDMITQQKHLVEEKQKEIVDSINYAKRIQYALLAHNDFLKQHLSEYFVLFKPKDIVSGDFYWATSTKDHFYIAVCDSTGHGVPGAFMSLLSISFLNEAINEKGLTQPDQVFNFVRTRLIDNVSGEGQKDGFDGILICLDKDRKKLSYAAANNAPVLIRNNELVRLEHDRMPVGAGEKKDPFRLFQLDLQKNDLVYMYTDGYYDQFGGSASKKFMSKNLNRLLLDIHSMPLHRQETILFDRFAEWKGELEQVDDICLAGLKI
ncbi:MAG: protein serine/threonine phosphatase [Bacteroidota bacterium]|jgi:serine phosphatase RsbU (regulator of sigma subunit)|nr:protein serine/threonine phosphatase [Bacteroidota bacterium]